jgi:hypothetical protein
MKEWDMSLIYNCKGKGCSIWTPEMLQDISLQINDIVSIPEWQDVCYAQGQENTACNSNGILSPLMMFAG